MGSPRTDSVPKVAVEQHEPAPGAMDAAWTFVRDHKDVDEAAVDAVNLNSLRRKIDWHIVPLMFLCYTMQFLDKVLLNYAAVMGIKKDLHLEKDEFSNVATFLFVGLICFEVPNSFLLQYFPAGKWLGFNVACWGIATACGAAATNYETLLVSRVFLGVFEATIAPSLMLISGQWYTKKEQAPRVSFWYVGLGVGQIVGGVVSYGFQHASVGSSSSFVGWRTMFVALGGFTVLLGITVFFFLPDTPMQASWMTTVEKLALLKHVAVNQTDIKNREWRYEEVIEALLDPQIYLLLTAVILLSISGGVVTTYSATLIRNLNYPPDKAALMNMPSGVVSIVSTLIVGYGIHKIHNRFLWCAVCIIPAIIGGALMSFLPITNKAGVLVGIYLVNAIVPPLGIYYSWIVANVGGATKRAFASAIVSGSFSIGNIIGPQTFRSKDAPEYRPAKIIVLATQAACLFTTFLLFLYYVWLNRTRRNLNVNVSKEQLEKEYRSEDTWVVLTDKENKSFRYMY